ncbi:MAG: alkaline phosphatase family protein [Gaiellaceae bacterium]
MRQVSHRLGGRRLLALAAAFALAAIISSAAAGSNGNGSGNDRLARINHIVVIYEENHSFDNLYGGWEGVNGRQNADAAHTTQVDQNSLQYTCLKQLDANLTSPIPLAATCNDTAHGFSSAFGNTYFSIDDFIKPDFITCPPIANAFGFPNGLRNPGINPANGQTVPDARSGGCTRDLVHEFYQEQYQLNGGQQNRYMSGSDSAGTTMGVYDTKALPIYRYLHQGDHPHYAILDNFFQAAFGGSFLNHQWLIAARTPTFVVPADSALHSIVDSNGMPVAYPLYTPTGTVRRGPLTATCASLPASVSGLACGNWAVNTMQPPFAPSGAFGAKLTVPLTTPTIGDRLNGAGLTWAWYAGGWNDAAAGHADPLFQFHHQPFNYFANYGPGMPGRAHLQDETAFEQLIASSGKSCNLPAVSFDKPIGEQNEHPGYASEPDGSDHLVNLLKGIAGGACAKDTMVIVTYDEFGGQWDHVSPPGQGGNSGPHDIWGPGTRIPALVISPGLRGNEAIDHTQYDTTSILRTIEERYNLAPVGDPVTGPRDAEVNSLSNVFDAKQYEAQK